MNTALSNLQAVGVGFLAQADKQLPVGKLVLYIGLLLLAVGVLILVAEVARRRLLGDSIDVESGVFTLGQLRQMKDAGQITADEFTRAKARVIADGRAMLEDPAGGEEGDSDNKPAP